MNITNFFDYSLYCASASLHAAGCRNFWFYSMVVLVVVCVLFILYQLSEIYIQNQINIDYEKLEREESLKRIKTDYNI